MSKYEERHLEFIAQKNSVDLLMDDEDIMIVSLDLFHIDKENEHNLNMCNISRECAEVSVPTFANKPISFRFNSKLSNMVDDVTEHFHNNSELFDMRVAGHIPPDSRITFVERENGKTYCNAEAVIQKRLLPKLVEILKANDGKMKISCVFKATGTQDKDTGIFIIEKFVLQEVTILSNKVQEGIEGSNMKVLKFSKQEEENANFKYLQFSKNVLSIEDIFVKIKNTKKEDIVLENSLGTRELEKRLWDKLKNYQYSDGMWVGHRYYIENILIDTKEVVVHDNQTDELYKIPYKISKEGDISIREEDKVKVAEDKNYREVKNSIEFEFAKEDYGSGDEVKVDKSKDAISDKKWGEINKTALRHKVLDAKNYKTLVHDVYLRVEDDWEEAPSEKLGYPVMEINGGKAVYNRYGLASALAYAKANNEEDIVEKVEKLYKTLDIIDDDEKANVATDTDNEVKDAHNKNDEGTHKSTTSETHDKENALDKEPLEKLDDDVDADKDYWKEKYDDLKKEHDELANKFKKAEKELETYHNKENREAMHAYLLENKDAFDEDEMKVMASKINDLKMSYDEFKKEVDEKFVSYLKNKYAKDKGQEKDKDKNNAQTLSFMANFNQRIATKKTSFNNILSSDEILDKIKEN